MIISAYLSLPIGLHIQTSECIYINVYFVLLELISNTLTFLCTESHRAELTPSFLGSLSIGPSISTSSVSPCRRSLKLKYLNQRMSGVKETLRIISYNHPSDDLQSVESPCIPPETESSPLIAAIPSNFRQPKVVFLWLPFLGF